MKFLTNLAAITALTLLLGCSEATNDSNSAQSTAKPNENRNANQEFSDQGRANASKKEATVIIEPGPEAQKKAQEAFILAQPGDVIEFAEGTFNFDGTLTFDGVSDVTVRGVGMEKTILNFSAFKAGKGKEGLKVKADNFTIEDLTIEDTPGDSIKLQDCDGLTMRRLKTWWSGGPDTKNGAYGLYPVLSNNVLIEHCVAEGASDAGIYVGQSKQVIVRNCRAEKNVAGIEVENCVGADVYDNVAANNTGGILVFSLPGLTIKNGSHCRVYNNEVASNNHPNFAEQGAIVSTVPPGTGIMIMANDKVEIFENKILDNGGAGCLIVSFLVSRRKFDDSEYDPYCESISIHNNTFKDGGQNVHGEFLKKYSDATGQALPDIVFDGIINSSKIKSGSLTESLQFSIKDNGAANFVNLDLGRMFAGEEPQVSTDLTPFNKSLESLGPVVISETE